MAILEHIIPDAGEHLTKWRETLVHHACLLEEKLDGIREAVQDTQIEPNQATRHVTGDGNSGAGNDVTVRLTPPPGYDWELTVLSCVSGGGGGLALYLGMVEPASLLYVVRDAQLASEILPDIPIPSGATLIAHFYSQPANTDCALRLILKSQERMG